MGQGTDAGIVHVGLSHISHHSAGSSSETGTAESLTRGSSQLTGLWILRGEEGT